MSDLELAKVKVGEQNVVVAYALWFFLGGIGIHRFYTKQSLGWLYIAGLIVGLATSLFVIGYFILIGLCVWWIVDGIKLNGVVQRFNLKLLEDYENSKNIS